MKWISSLYDKPNAFIKYAGFKSDPFPIGRGTRQGCPLSPLLFALLIEPLAHLIRSDPNIKGIELAGCHHKVCLFADDILLFMSSPHITAPNLLSVLNHFAHILGLTGNYQKSTALNISLPPSDLQLAKDSLPFSWTPHRLPYLGIQLTPKITDLYSANFPPLLKQVTELLSQWSSIPLSWIGKINVIKMAILPKFLYLFRVLPIPFPLIQRRIISFIWGKRNLEPLNPLSVSHNAAEV